MPKHAAPVLLRDRTILNMPEDVGVEDRCWPQGLEPELPRVLWVALSKLFHAVEDFLNRLLNDRQVKLVAVRLARGEPVPTEVCVHEVLLDARSQVLI